ncbi:histidine kinase [Actinoplanes sp. NPDC051494]|uniref:histidine kinase n=1 Tax=Actinoplanes sp. NPDC051494 TaxID=3363907 RepID=UPI003792D561
METRDLARIKAFKKAAEKPLLLDVLLALVLSWAVMKKATVDGATPALGDGLVALVAFIAVLLRRVHPMLALAVATVASIGAIMHGVSNPGQLVAIGVITYSIAAHTDRRKGMLCALGASAVIYLTGLIVAVDDWWKFETIGIFAWIFLAAAVGDAVRSHRAYIREVEDRAQRAEQTRDEEARRRVMDERVRIARELHDVVAHHIAVISVQAGAAAHVLERRPDQVGPVLAHIREASDTVLREIQSVVGVLRNEDEAESTEPTPGMARLPELLSGLEQAGFSVRPQQRGRPRELPALVDLAAYRIVQEAVTNAHKHGCGPIRLLVEYAPAGVVIEVTNEIRPAPVSPGSGYGLLGMRERAASAGGDVTTGPLGDGRFRVHAVLPAADPAAQSPSLPADAAAGRGVALPTRAAGREAALPTRAAGREAALPTDAAGCGGAALPADAGRAAALPGPSIACLRPRLPAADSAGPGSDLPVRVLHAVTGFNDVEAALSRTTTLMNGLRSCAVPPREEHP